MIITIEGKPEEGKTALAVEICKGKETVRIEAHRLNSPFWAWEISSRTDFVLIDDVTSLEAASEKFRSETLTINRGGKRSFIVKMPNIILIKYS